MVVTPTKKIGNFRVMISGGEFDTGEPRLCPTALRELEIARAALFPRFSDTWLSLDRATKLRLIATNLKDPNIIAYVWDCD